MQDQQERKWEPYTSRGARLRIHDTSCCGEYDLGSAGGEYFVLRRTADGGYEETGRGRYGLAIRVWAELTEAHQHPARTAS